MKQSDALAKHRCGICQSPTRPLYLWQTFQVYSCARCGQESVSPIPSEEELKHYYETVFYQTHDDIKVARWEIKLHLIQRAFTHYLDRYRRFNGNITPRTFIDVGGGLGFYARSAMDHGIDTCLIDYGATALTFAQEKLGVTWTVQGDVQKCAEHVAHDTFDFVLARHVIEHMRNPTEFVDNIRKILHLGALAQIETPNVSTWEQFAHPRQIANHFQILRKSNPHLSRISALRLALQKSMSGINPPKHLWGFTRESLTLLLEENGFEILDIARPIFGSRVFDPLYYETSRLAGRTGLGIPYYFFERAVSPIAVGNGANLVILARRTR